MSNKITAGEARNISEYIDATIVQAGLDTAYSEIRKAAENRDRYCKLTGDMWTGDPLINFKEYHQIVSILRQDGFGVTLESPTHSQRSYTLIKW